MASSENGQKTSGASTTPQATGELPGRLVTIDSLRGVAALAVVFSHVVGAPTWVERWPPADPIVGIAALFPLGFAGVYLFFIISGFCIHFRYARQLESGQAPRVDFVSFWKRRIKRLYPAYFVALLLYLAVKYASTREFSSWGALDTTLHLLLLHNIDSRTSHTICGVFWTLAIEEQLYLAYFALLAMRNRFGWKLSLAGSFIVRLGWMLFFTLFSEGIYKTFHIQLSLPAASAQYWFIWILGAISAEAVCNQVKLPHWCRSMPLAAWLVATAAVLHLLRFWNLLRTPAIDLGVALALDTLWAVGFWLFFNAVIAYEVTNRRRSKLPRLVTLTAAIGTFSYSLYLTHLLVIERFCRALGWSGNVHLELLLILPAIGFAYVFYLIIEKPCVDAPRNNSRELAAKLTAPGNQAS